MEVQRQKGAALLLLLLVIVVAASSVLVSTISDARLRLNRAGSSQAALAEAKRALLAYAATQPDLLPGAPAGLPCPDIDASGGLPDGEAHTTGCGATGVSVLGRVPWRTLGVAPPRDSSGSCLWYAVSGSYKSAGGSTMPLINPDSNGQLQLVSMATGNVVGSGLPEDRPVAVLIAPHAPLAGQQRNGGGPTLTECGGHFSAADYLDDAPGIGISNAALSGVPHTIDALASSAGVDGRHNDALLAITREELANVVLHRHDFVASMSLLTRGIASCLAAYGQQNPGGATDRRLPWPAPVQLGDYLADADYDDASSTPLSGRVPDVVDDSSAETGNSVSRVLGNCSPLLAPDWDPGYLSLWQNWKDHFFYAVAESYRPDASLPTDCSTCLSVNGGGSFAAIVIFAGARLATLGQRRNSPPLDGDTRNDITNYLEGRNASNHPYTSGVADYELRAAANDFNDIAFCIDGAMNVSAC